MAAAFRNWEEEIKLNASEKEWYWPLVGVREGEKKKDWPWSGE